MNQPTRRSLQVLLPLLIVAAGFLAMEALAGLKKEPVVTPPAPIVPLVETRTVSEGPVELTVHTQGTVRPRTRTTLIAEVAGRVLSVAPALADGGFFEPGDLLLELDETDLVLALEEARGRVARAALVLAQEEADAEVAGADWRRAHGAEPPPPLVAHAPQLASARAELEAARAAQTKASRDVERAKVRAPYSGRVRERHVDVGAYVQAGARLADVYAVDVAEVPLLIPDSDLALLELPLHGAATDAGPRVHLEADFAGARRTWEGRIVRVGGAIDPESRMVTVVALVDDPYRLEQDGEGAPLFAGLFVEATLEGRTLANAVTLPRDALRPGKRVFTLDANDRLEIRAVEVVDADATRAVVASGLRTGDRIVLSPIENPVAGMQLRDRANALADSDAPGASSRDMEVVDR